MPHNMLCGILDKCQHYVWTELLWLDEWKIARDEHAEIVDAICAGDPARAGTLARAHVPRFARQCAAPAAGQVGLSEFPGQGVVKGGSSDRACPPTASDDKRL